MWEGSRDTFHTGGAFHTGGGFLFQGDISFLGDISLWGDISPPRQGGGDAALPWGLSISPAPLFPAAAGPGADRSCFYKALAKLLCPDSNPALCSAPGSDVYLLARADPIRRGCVAADPTPSPACVLHVFRKPVLDHVSQWAGFGEVHTECPITAGCCRDVTSHVSISRKLSRWLNSQNAG